MAKKGGGSQTVKDYYSSQGALFDIGEADTLLEIQIDGKNILSSEVDLTLANPTLIDVIGYGRIIAYRGTFDQVISDSVITSARGHTPHRFVIKLVFVDFLSGRERTSVPDVTIVYRRKGSQTLIVDDAGSGKYPTALYQGQSNMMVPLAEMMENSVYGLGKPERVDVPSWQALADATYLARAYSYVSPRMDKQISMRSFFDLAAGYLDCIFRTNEEGKIVVHRFEKNAAAPIDLVVVTDDDIEPGTNPEITTVPLSKLPSFFSLKWTNPDSNYGSASAQHRNRHARSAASNIKPVKYDREWYQVGNSANRAVMSDGKRDSTPYRKVEGLSIRESKAMQLEIGKPFLLAIEYKGREIAIITIPLDIRGFGDGEAYAEIGGEEARGYYITPEFLDFVDDVFEDDPEVADLDYWHPLQATARLSGTPYSVMVLAGRTSGLTSGYNLYFRATDTSYQNIGGGRGWAYPVELAADYSSSQPDQDYSGTLRIRKLADPNPAPFGWEELPTVMTADEVEDNYLLLIAIDSANPEAYEIMSVRVTDSPVGSEYPMQIKRARLGTVRRSFAEGDRAYLVLRDSLSFFGHEQIDSLGRLYPAEDRVVHFKIQPLNFRSSLDLEDATEKSLQLERQFVNDPANFRVSGIISGFELSFDCSDSDVHTAYFWFSDNASRPSEPTTHREAKQGKNTLNYLNERFSQPRTQYVWLQIEDVFGNLSNIVGPEVANSSNSVIAGQFVQVTADEQFVTDYHSFGGIHPSEINLYCEAFGFVNPSFQWQKNENETGFVDIEDAINPTLTYPSSQLASVTRFRCVVSGTLYDEISVYVAIYGTSDKVVLLSNPAINMLVDSSGIPLDGQTGPESRAVSKVKVFSGVNQLIPVAASSAGNEFHISVPAGFVKVGNDEFYLDDPDEVDSDEKEFTISATIFGVGTFDAVFRVRKVAQGSNELTMTITTDQNNFDWLYGSGDPAETIPSDNTIEFLSVVRRGADIVASRLSEFTVDPVTGEISITSGGGFFNQLVIPIYSTPVTEYKIAYQVVNDGSNNVATFQAYTRAKYRSTALQRDIPNPFILWDFYGDSPVWSHLDEQEVDYSTSYDSRLGWNGLVFEDTLFGSAAVFNGVDSYTECTRARPFPEGGCFIYVVFRNDSLSPSGRQMLAFSGSSSVENMAMYLDFDTDTIVFRSLYDQLSDLKSEASFAWIPDNALHCLIVELDVAASQIRMHLDGTLMATESLTPSTMPDPSEFVTDAGSRTMLGAGYDGSVMDVFDGAICGYEVYSTDAVPHIAWLSKKSLDFEPEVNPAPFFDASTGKLMHPDWYGDISAYWPFRDSKDPSIGSENLTLEIDNGVLGVDGDGRSGISFDGSGGLRYSFVNNAVNCGSANGLTIMFGMRSNSVTVLDCPVDTDQNNGIRFFVTDDTVRLSSTMRGAFSDFSTFEGSVGVGGYHRIAIVFSSNALSNVVLIYVDGILAGARYSSSAPSGDASAGSFSMGAEWNNLTSSFTREYNGWLYDMVCVQRALTPREIRSACMQDTEMGWLYEYSGSTSPLKFGFQKSYASESSDVLVARPRHPDSLSESLSLPDIAGGSGIALQANLISDGSGNHSMRPKFTYVGSGGNLNGPSDFRILNSSPA